MAEGAGQGVAGVLRHGSAQVEQAPDHEGHLLLGRGTGAGDAQLDLARAVFRDLQAPLHRGDQQRAADVAEHEGRAHALGVERLFDHDRVRAPALHDLTHPYRDVVEPLRQAEPGGRSDGAVGQAAQAIALPLHQTVAGPSAAGVQS